MPGANSFPQDTPTEGELIDQINALLDAVEPAKRRQVLAAVAERNDLRVSEKVAVGRTYGRPAPRWGKTRTAR